MEAMRAVASEGCRFEGLSSGCLQLIPRVNDGSHNEPRAAIIAEVRAGEAGRSQLVVRLLDASLLPSQRSHWIAWWLGVLSLNLLYGGFSLLFLALEAFATAFFAIVYFYTLSAARRTRDRDHSELIAILERGVSPFAAVPAISQLYRNPVATGKS